MSGLLWKDISEGGSLPKIDINVDATKIISGAIASRDFSPLHHDVAYARDAAGHKDIFLNTPTLSGYFERLLFEWAGPKGRPGRMKIAMKKSVYPGDEIELSALIKRCYQDEHGCGWVDLDMQLDVVGETAVRCAAKYAVPIDDNDDPWQRQGKDWQP